MTKGTGDSFTMKTTALKMTQDQADEINRLKAVFRDIASDDCTATCSYTDSDFESAKEDGRCLCCLCLIKKAKQALGDKE